MCVKAPKIPKAVQPAEVQTPDLNSILRARKKSAAAAGGTLLTGPSGIDNQSVNTGANTLLGG